VNVHLTDGKSLTWIQRITQIHRERERGRERKIEREEDIAIKPPCCPPVAWLNENDYRLG